MFCDFVPGYLVPIYKLIPAGHKLTAEAIKRASDDHQQWAVKSRNMRSGIKLVTFETNGDVNTRNVQRASAKDHDEEIGTKQGKNVYWKLTVQLLNVEDGGRCGFGISLRVSEGGMSDPSSVLLNTYTKVVDLELGLSQMSINTDYFGGGEAVFTAEDTWTGQFHGWHDATSSVLKGTAGTVLCHEGNTVEIMVDDKGKDLGHIGVKGTIMIPWIGY